LENKTRNFSHKELKQILKTKNRRLTMIKRIENKSNSKPTATVVKGKVESLNEKGLKVNSHWYNFQQFLE
jgi:hypothetical protein